ncbi:MAG TPA: sugar transferase [Dinghuibacter sp.]|jgi:lipopolysaccharide/colanic/teichoic acid biosynthesis glycosyltransferase|uniref:sugar transferase n=1 Tax=Dinghuibacter sp. TaxID=2024697 RepID=UPI002C4771D2|nr:sugar transferase [Dinghuibacter sp.]HTJ10945.1 sugar transferase [Dinghuibacter sp.]
MNPSYLSVKRYIDIILSLVALILTLPFLLLALVLLSFVHKGNPFFRQRRPGLHGRSFVLLKFKTMTDKTDSQGRLLPDEERLTPVGAIIRAASLDELPQLINVLKGEMSLVGPRPLLEEYLPLYTPTEARRHSVRPGITGWAQVNGRNLVAWKQKFEYDVWYVDHVSFLLDLRIFALTVLKVFGAEGIGSGTSATMEKFSKSL